MLDRRLEQLGPDLVITAALGLDRAAQYEVLKERVRRTQFDADEMVKEVREALPYHMSRMVLQEHPPQLPKGAPQS